MPWLGKAWQPWLEEAKYVRNVGPEVRENTVRSVEGLARILGSSLGPRGLSKIILPPPPRRPKITSDGMTILRNLEILHPTAKMVREIGVSQAEEVGDGVITSVVLAFELLKQAKELSYAKIHPVVIVSGFTNALKHCLDAIRKISIPVSWQDPKQMFRVALTAASTKSAGIDAAKLAECAATALPYVVDIQGEKSIPQIRRLCVLKKVGGSTHQSRLVRGMVFDRPLRDTGMPKRTVNPRIAMLRCGLEIKKWYDRGFKPRARVEVRSPEALRRFVEGRKKVIRDQVNIIIKSGANVVVTSDRSDDAQASLLARHGIQLVTGVADEGGVGRLAHATGGRVVSYLDDLSPNDLGYAEVAEEIAHGGSKLFVIDGCKDPRAATILLAGAVESILDESERALDSAISVCADIVKDPRIVGGAGSLEAELAFRVRKYAPTVEGKGQLAVLAFADALEGMIGVLARNLGQDSIESVLKLRAAHSEQQGRWIGLNLKNKEVCDALEMGIVEPAVVKEHALTAATELACQILRIDERLVANQKPKYMPGEIPGIGDLHLGTKAMGPSFGPEDLPDETKKAMKKGKYLKIPGSRFKPVPF